MDNLSDLDRAAVMVYEREMQRTLDDPGRLKAVYSAKFAAEPVRERIRTICQTTRTMLNVDGCEANLITDTEQYDISTDVDHPLKQSFCKFVVNERALFHVENARTHKLVCESTSVTERGIRSYLGLPLLWNDFAVGAFCVFTTTPRVWKPFEVQVLAGLAVAVVDTMSWDHE